LFIQIPLLPPQEIHPHFVTHTVKDRVHLLQRLRVLVCHSELKTIKNRLPMTQKQPCQNTTQTLAWKLLLPLLDKTLGLLIWNYSIVTHL
jgi:hypothetical protein